MDLGVTLDSSVTFSNHISNLTRSTYFQLRRLRAIREFEIPVFTSIVHAFVCSRTDYCNSLLIGFHKVWQSPIQTVLNASARLVPHLLRFSHISSFMTQQLHWLPFTIYLLIHGLSALRCPMSLTLSLGEFLGYWNWLWYTLGFRPYWYLSPFSSPSIPRCFPIHSSSPAIAFHSSIFHCGGICSPPQTLLFFPSFDRCGSHHVL